MTAGPAALSAMFPMGGTVTRTKAKVKANGSFEGVDLDKALAKMVKLPSAMHLVRTPTLNVQRSQTKADVSGRATWTSRGDRGHISITIGYNATIHNVLGTLLHEVAHHAARLAPRARPEDSNDSSPKFAKRCHDLHDEWNRRWGSRTAEVSKHITGAYRGRSACRDYKKAHVPAVTDAKPVVKEKPVHVITTDNNNRKWFWQLADEIHENGVEVAIPGTLACELTCRVAETTEDGSADWRHRFAEIWSEGRTRRAGKGSQRVVKFGPGELTKVLRPAIEWGVWDYGDEPLADRQAAQVLSRLINVKEG